MNIPYFEVLAFTSRHFAGNPAGVCVLDEWLPETAFIIERDKDFDLRWMTPTVEADLCGHATLASAHVIFHHVGRRKETVSFQSHSGELRVDRKMDQLILDFPSQPACECKLPKNLAGGLRAQPKTVLKGRDYLAVFEREDDVAAINPDFEVLKELDSQGVIVTAAGDSCDFVSRYFAPAAGIPEDPVTGSTHCALIPYWSKRLGKGELRARQISKRGGELFCEDRGDRVGIGGNAVTYLDGHFHVQAL
jgi:PhzF family phenazine biosynthesis protein